jgi:signal transduction histidine kinase
MESVIKYIFFFMIGTTLLNLCFAVVARINTKNTLFNMLIFYWISLFINFAATAVLSGSETQILYSFFFQSIPLLIFAKVLSDSRGLEFYFGRHVIGYAGAMTLTTLAQKAGLSFTIALIPLVSAYILTFLRPALNTFVDKKNPANWIEKSIASVFFMAIVNIINFALFRLDDSSAWWGWSIAIAQYQCASVLLPMIIYHRRELNERQNLELALERLSGQNQNDHLRIEELYSQIDSQLKQKITLNHKLAASNVKLEEEQEINEILIKTISHDLANPLTVINAYSEMLSSGKVAVKEREKIWGRVKLNTQSALEMIHRIRTAILTRSQADMLEMNDVDLEIALHSLSESFDSRLQEKGLTLKINFLQQGPVFVRAEEKTLVDHVFSNILSNAIKFSFQHSSIEINVGAKEECVVIEFRDHGQGIKKQRLEKKLLSTTEGTNGESGTGFGLMVMGYFLRQFGGAFSIESYTAGPERGTSFKVSLQRAQAHDHLHQPQLIDANLSGQLH